MAGDGDGWVTQEEMAEMSGVSARTIRRWLTSGTLPSVKRGSTRRIHLSKVRAELPVTFELLQDDDE